MFGILVAKIKFVHYGDITILELKYDIFLITMQFLRNNYHE